MRLARIHHRPPFPKWDTAVGKWRVQFPFNPPRYFAEIGAALSHITTKLRELEMRRANGRQPSCN